MADTYYQTAIGIGVVDDPANVPAGATIITQGAYEVELAAWQTAQNNANNADQASAETRFTNAYKAYKSVGMTNAEADLLASAVGRKPVGFDPNIAFTPFNVTYETSGTLTFDHSLTGAANAWEEITEIPDLVIVEAGVYEVKTIVRASATFPLQASSTGGTNAGTAASIFKNGAQVNGSQVEVAMLLQGSLTTAGAGAQPALQMQGTTTGSFITTCAAGDVLDLRASRFGAVTGSNSIISNTDGRTRFTATRIRR